MALPQFHSIIPLPIFGNGIATITQKKKFRLFRQYHCHNYKKKKKLPISAIPLPQFFFTSHFRQWHCHNYQKKKKSSISAISLPQFYSSEQFFHPFRQSHCHNSIPFFFFFLPHIFGNGIAEIGENFFHLFRQSHCHNSILFLFFLFFSSHFRQWHCRNR